MFISLSILQHYVEFDIRTIITLENLFGARSFSGFISHLTYCQTTLLAFLGGLGFPSIIWIIAFAFLGCWALITLALVTHFQQDDHPIFLDAITHVETNIFSFQMVL
jgi:hypothetical protein